MYWHSMSPQEVATELEVNLETGLKENEAVSRLHKYGPNELIAQKNKSVIAKFFEQFKDFMIMDVGEKEGVIES